MLQEPDKLVLTLICSHQAEVSVVAGQVKEKEMNKHYSVWSTASVSAIQTRLSASLPARSVQTYVTSLESWIKFTQMTLHWSHGIKEHPGDVRT